TFFGIIPGTFVYAGVGAKAGQAFDAGEELSLGGLLLQPDTIAILAVFIILAVAPIIMKGRGKKNEESA
ncbi:MAG: TVP38/TMEM64 family protein, partial [Planctomycetota bacterium]